MTINSLDIACDRVSSKSEASSKCLKRGTLPGSRLVKIDFAAEGSICSVAIKHGKNKKNLEYKSPYLSGDNVQLITRLNEKRLVRKKGTNIVSSFPLAANVYKANSDEFKASKKKTQKSVLTIPNKPAPIPQLCTVSDINDSEYFNRNEENRKKSKKRTPATRTRKRRAHGKDFEFYDRSSQYCSQMKVKLDCGSSTDIIKKYDVDEKLSKSNIGSRSRVEVDAHPHEVWAVLRDLNRFQFNPSPPMSEDSFISPKKMKSHKRCNNNKKDMRVFETCCTEFAYISSFGVDNKSNCSFMSPCSMDTVIEKESGFKLSEILEKKQSKGNNNKKRLPIITTSNNMNVARNKCLPTKLNNIKKIANGNQNNNSDNVYGDSSFECPDNKCDKKISESNTFHQGFENKIIKNDYVPDTPQINQYGELSYSGTSGSRLIKFNKQTNKNVRRGNNKSPIFHLEESNQAINGITKVVVCKGQNVVPTNRSKSPKRKPFTNLNNQQKLTNTEIRRRLSKQKFPIVILGKDQLSSTIEVIKEEPPQFNGLGEQVWPFMLKWYGIEPKDTHDALKTKLCESNGHTKRIKHVDVAKNVESRFKNGPKTCRFKDKTSDKELKCIKTGRTVPAQLSEILDQPQQRVKSKPIRQFRDRMLKLLYKNSSSVLSVIDGSPNSESAKKLNNIYNNKASKVDVCTDTGFDIDEKSSIKTRAGSTKPKIFSSTDKRPWAKAKWASDFIDNVIRKIKSGAYYTHDSKVINQSSDHESKEVEIQTDSSCDIHDEKSITIPGFDNVQPAVEIQTMNMNEIAVKHLVTNIMIYFDVTVPTKPIVNAKDASSLVPINVDENRTNIFKCKTSILNAMLPAELCCLLPKMLRKIAHLREPLPRISIPIDKSSCLSTISKVSQCKIPKETHKVRNYILHIAMSQELRRLVNGSFRNTDNMHQKLHIVRNTSLIIKYERHFVQEFKLDVKRDPLLNNNNIIENPIKTLTVNTQESILKLSYLSSKHNNTCTALQPYASERRIIPSFKPFDLKCLFKNMISFVNYNGASCISIKNSNYDNLINIGITIRHHINVQNRLTIGVGDFNMFFSSNGFFNSFATNYKINFFNSKNGTSKEPMKCVDYVETLESSSNSKEYDTLQTDISVNNNKVRRKGYVKLYKKCKSNSNLYGEKATPLSKITHLDDFFQALGSGKLLSTVFDSQSGQKILSSVQEMKNWTSEINPRQALLVLLLMNKKDTTNLLRYRQVLLQGIAVNRITKSEELDMEIEVIERENLNKLSQHDGISYVPASIENRDNLFEELCWIAKTTASDYQRQFDESSEKLLKSLLEKRKKLNPSYLRVMARYVGLGLLKSPGKKL